MWLGVFHNFQLLVLENLSIFRETMAECSMRTPCFRSCMRFGGRLSNLLKMTENYCAKRGERDHLQHDLEAQMRFLSAASAQEEFSMFRFREIGSTLLESCQQARRLMINCGTRTM
ncbi:hypothetical protein KC19_VG005600 [Ceratodon purpureus]|uniref:Uncharacterized protein n=1 Tax=Ceratodon purpureus TaxID=3225 RepID=A0A8T0HKR6_CERPU|nr:hypothetical protein KC19_VG005600 [Ceratodon purpureus]